MDVFGIFDGAVAYIRAAGQIADFLGVFGRLMSGNLVDVSSENPLGSLFTGSSQ